MDEYLGQTVSRGCVHVTKGLVSQSPKDLSLYEARFKAAPMGQSSSLLGVLYSTYLIKSWNAIERKSSTYSIYRINYCVNKPITNTSGPIGYPVRPQGKYSSHQMTRGCGDDFFPQASYFCMTSRREAFAWMKYLIAQLWCEVTS